MRTLHRLRQLAFLFWVIAAANAAPPVFFVSNSGHKTGEAHYFADTSQTRVYFNSGELVFRRGGSAVRVRFAGSSPDAPIEGSEALAGQVHLLLGDNPASWRRNLPTYGGVVYRRLYPGIDFRFGSRGQQLQSQFVIASGADASLIRSEYDGVEKLEIDADGALTCTTATGILRMTPPNAYQEIDGLRRPVEAHFRLVSSMELAIDLSSYSTSQPVVVDPALTLATYLGGTGLDSATAVATDGAGNIYVAGSSDSATLPTANPLQGTKGGGVDAFVAKYAADGHLVYCTYLGGDMEDRAAGIAVDSAGNAYVTGWTQSTNFPVRGGVQARGAGGRDAFVTKLNAAGTGLVFSTYFGGSGYDCGNGIALDTSGAVYVAGETTSTDLPFMNGYRTSPAGLSDAFVLKLLPSGGGVDYATYLGGHADDSAHAIAVDAAGNAYITGMTWSTDFPTALPVQPAAGGNQDAFVAKLNASGTALVYSTYLGGSGGTMGLPEAGNGIAIDRAGNAYVTGVTSSSNFPLANAVQASHSGSGTDAFLAKLNASGGALVYSTYLGGSNNETGTAIAVDSAGAAYVVGYTSSADFPTASAVQTTLGGSYDAFLTQFSADGRTLVQSTFLGGSGSDAAYGVAVDASNIYIAGQTASLDFPVRNNIQKTMAGGYDAFLAIFKIVVPPCSYTVTPPNLSLAPYSASVSLDVVTASNCSWSPTSASGWITLPTQTITGSGSMTVTVSANQGSARSGTILIGGKTINVVQTADLEISGYDFNQDGHPDIVWQDPNTGYSQVWYLDGSRSATVVGAAGLSAAQTWRIAAVADLDGDGHPDLVWQDPNTGQAQVWLMGGSQGTTLLAAVTISIGTTWRIVATGDFNHDGRADLVWQDPSGRVQIWFIGGSPGQVSIIGAVNLAAANAWRVAGSGDFNGDGHPDLIWQDPVTGAAQVWLLGGTQGDTLLGIISLGSNAWRIAAVGDFDRDGHPDLIWQDPVTGASQIWFLGGSQGVGIVATATLARGSSWRVAAPR